jgi:hypothetical protein
MFVDVHRIPDILGGLVGWVFQRVFREAEQTAIALRNKHPEWKQPTEDDEEEKPTTWIHSKPISNLGWLEFQQK